MNPDYAVSHHYRIPEEEINYAGYILLNEKANILDHSLLQDVPLLTEAIPRRFQIQDAEDVHDFLEHLAQERPPASSDAAAIHELS